jgi:hypothetical protein
LIPETAPAKPSGTVKPVIASAASPGEPAGSPSSAKLHVKTVLVPPSAPALPKVTVKPALNSSSNPPKPKNQQ